MSDEWCPDHDGSHCHALRDLAERVSRLESGEDDDRITIGDLRDSYEEGVQDSMLLRATQYKRILLDLIAELRAEHEWHYTAMANRAEARLREVTDD